MLLSSTVIATLVGFASAAAFTRDDSGFKTLSQAVISTLSPYANYAAAAMCGIGNLQTWDCGSKCEANPSFQYLTSGGDGKEVPYWYVGYDPSLNQIMVVHQGSDKRQFFTDLTDTEGSLVKLDGSLFPNISSFIQVYKGFAEDQSKTAAQVINAVGYSLSHFPDAGVTTVGYSLGAAVALLDAIYLKLQLPSVQIKTFGYGMTRVGNQDFADFVDQLLPGSVTHINNKKDPMPIVPSINRGYHQPSGEIHIQEQSGDWIVCPGQDNSDPRCSAGTVSSISDAVFSDHRGAYGGVMMTC